MATSPPIQHRDAGLGNIHGPFNRVFATMQDFLDYTPVEADDNKLVWVAQTSWCYLRYADVWVPFGRVDADYLYELGLVQVINGVSPSSGTVTLTTDQIPQGDGNKYFAAGLVLSTAMAGLEATIAATPASNPLDSDNLVVVLAKLRKLIIASGGGGALTNTDDLDEGTTNLYFREQRVIDSLLAGLALGTTTDLVDGISIIEALGRLQSKASAAVTALAGKASATALADHVGNTSNPHSLTKAQIGLSNVEDKSSATIRGEITSGNVTSALGFSPFDASNVDTSSALGASNTKVPSQLAVKTAIANAVSGLWDMKDGGIDCAGNPNYPAAEKGDAYAVTVAGKIGGGSGRSVDVGDIAVALADNAGGTQASVGASWLIFEHNLVGALLGSANLADLTNPGTARGNLGLVIGTDVQAQSALLSLLAGLTPAANKLPYFTGGTGAALADLTAAGRALLDDADATAQRVTLGLGTAATLDTGTSSGNVLTRAQLDTLFQPLDSDLTAIAALSTTSFGRAFLALADAAALRTAAGLGTSATLNIDTDGTLAGNSNSLIPTQAAVRAAINALLDAMNAEVYKGLIDCSANPNYPAANSGEVYRVSVAGKIGGVSGINVEVNDRLQCITDSSASGNHATVGANWWIQQGNIDGAVTGPAAATASAVAVFSGTTGKLITDSGKALPGGVLIGTTDAQTLTNKRIQSRIVVVTQSATPTINLDTTDIARITGLAQAITSVNTSGTPVDGDGLMVEITGTATRAIAWGTGFVSSGLFALPTTTSGTTTLRTWFIYDGTLSKHVCIGSA